MDAREANFGRRDRQETIAGKTKAEACNADKESRSASRHPTVPHDPHLDARAKKATERASENMHILVNDPSLALYRMQEHIRKSLPPTVERRAEVVQLHQQLQGHCYDAEYAINAVKAMQKAEPIFSNIQELLRNSLFFRQQLLYEEKRKSDEAQSIDIKTDPTHRGSS